MKAKFSKTILISHLLSLALSILAPAPVLAKPKHQDEIFTGISLSSNQRTVAVTSLSGNRDNGVGRMSLVSLADQSRIDVALPDGILPFNPEFHPKDQRVLFSGYCTLKSDCNDEASGWNIYLYDIEDESVSRLTEPAEGEVRWKLLWDSTGDIYYTVFDDKGSPFNRQHSPGTSIRILRNDGQGDIYFPRSKNGESDYHPGSSLQTVELLKVDDGELYFFARLFVKIRRPTEVLTIFAEEGRPFDDRITRFLDKEFYDEDIHGGDTILGTLFSVSPSTFRRILEPSSIREMNPSLTVPDRIHFTHAASDGDSIWMISYGYNDFSHRVLQVEGAGGVMSKKRGWVGNSLIDFDVVGNAAVGFLENFNDRDSLFYMLDWDIALTIDLN